MAKAKIGTGDMLVCNIGSKPVTRAYLGKILVCDAADQFGLLIRYNFAKVKTGRKVKP